MVSSEQGHDFLLFLLKDLELGLEVRDLVLIVDWLRWASHRDQDSCAW